MIERSSDDDSIGERVPRPLSKDADSDLQKWLTELQTAADEVDSGVEDARVSSQIRNASGDALDELGKDFGPLGKRRGRNDSQYRSFLLGLVGAFDGRGTARGIRTAVAAGILADLEDVSLIEDESELEYEVVLENAAWEPHQSGAVRELADLADPSVVQLRDPVHNILSTSSISPSPSSAQHAAIESRSEPAVVVVKPAVATKESVAVGLSSAELRDLSADDWVLSTIKRPAATVKITGRETIHAAMHTSPSARSTVRGADVVTPLMTRVNPARIGVTAANSTTETLSERGFSSAQLGPLSSTDHAELSTI